MGFLFFFLLLPVFAIYKKPVMHLESQLFTVLQCSTEFARMYGRFKNYIYHIVCKKLWFSWETKCQINQRCCGCGGWATDGVSSQKMIRKRCLASLLQTCYSSFAQSKERLGKDVYLCVHVFMCILLLLFYVCIHAYFLLLYLYVQYYVLLCVMYLKCTIRSF